MDGQPMLFFLLDPILEHLANLLGILTQGLGDLLPDDPRFCERFSRRQ